MLSEILLGVITGLVALCLGLLALGIAPADLGRRWSVGDADQVLHYTIFASALDTFPFFPNGHLGFPESQNLFFAPLFDVWSSLYVAVAGLFVPNSVWALNLYNVGSFFVVGVTSYAFFRALKLRRLTSVVFGVLFATVSYHFYQLTIGHPFLSNYWALPLAGILVLMVAGDRTNPFAGWIGRAPTRRAALFRRLLPIVVLTPLVALTQSYYFVFGAIIVGGVWFVGMLAAVIGGAGWRSLRWPTVTAAALFVLIGVQLGVLSLNLGDRYQKYFGARTFTDSETYGGTFMDLLLPARQSGIPPLANRSAYYHATSTLLTSSESSSTAVVASVAIALSFLLLMLRTASVPLPAPPRPGRLRSAVADIVADPRIAVLLVAFVGAFLFFITGGLGTALAFFGSPEIRAWSRMSIVISMAALGILAVVIEKLTKRTWSLLVVLVVVAVVASVDQYPRIADTMAIAPVDDSALKSFTRGVEAELPPGCGVAVLPLKGFPETGPVGRMGDYDEGLLYVYAADDDLRWSYGAVNGTRSGDFWASASTPGAFAADTAEAGACAVIVDTFAYSDNVGGWRPFVAATGDEPSTPDLASSDRRYLFFRIGQ